MINTRNTLLDAFLIT